MVVLTYVQVLPLPLHRVGSTPLLVVVVQLHQEVIRRESQSEVGGLPALHVPLRVQVLVERQLVLVMELLA